MTDRDTFELARLLREGGFPEVAHELEKALTLGTKILGLTTSPGSAQSFVAWRGIAGGEPTRMSADCAMCRECRLNEAKRQTQSSCGGERRRSYWLGGEVASVA